MRRSTALARVIAGLVCQTSARKGGMLRRAPMRSDIVRGAVSGPPPWLIAAPAGGSRPPMEYLRGMPSILEHPRSRGHVLAGKLLDDLSRRQDGIDASDALP